MPLVHQRVVEVFASSAGHIHRGSGYLVGPRTVLTAGQVVQSGHRRVTVRFGNDNREWPATVAWCATGGPDRVDAAVLHLDDTGRLPEWIREAALVRYGQVITRTGTLSAEAAGFPSRREEVREIERWAGSIDYGPGTVLQRMSMVIAGAPPAVGDPAPWSGLSGGTVWSNGLLIGIVAHDPQAWSDGRLSVEPIRRLLPSVEFARALAVTGAGPVTPEAVELAALAPGDAGQAASPAQLLRAEAQAVEFHGRTAELRQLDQWADGGGAGVLLIHGAGGQGKTRLALEWLRRRRLAGWAATVARTGLAGIEFDDPAIERALTEATVPVVIMIDHADDDHPPGSAGAPDSARHGDPSNGLPSLLERRDPAAAPVRILLVARTAGAWWREFDRSMTTTTIALTALAPNTKARPALYRAALSDFAARLGRTDGYADGDWRRTAEALEPPRALGQPRNAHALTLFEQALAGLLQAGPTPVDAASHDCAADILLAHEAHYWARTAGAHGVRSSPAVLREAVAALALFGAADRDRAEGLVAALPGLDDATADDSRRVTAWLAELYPDAHAPWAPMEPTDLADHLIATVWGTGDELSMLVNSHLPVAKAIEDDTFCFGDDQLDRMFAILARAAEHPTHRHERLGQLALVLRSQLTNAKTRAHRPDADQHAYHLLDAMKARISLEPDGDGSGSWRPRWAWWNSRRAARVIAAKEYLHLAFAEFDGGRGVLAVNSTTATIFDPVSGERAAIYRFRDPADDRVITAACSTAVAGKLYLAIVFEDGEVTVWRLTDGGVCEPAGLPGPPIATRPAVGVAMIEVAGRLLLVVSPRTGRLVLRDAHTDEQLGELAAEDTIDLIATTRFGRPALVTLSADQRIRVFDLARRELVDTLERHTSTPGAIAVFHSGGAPEHREQGQLRVLVGCEDGSVHVMDPQTGACLAELIGHSRPVTAVRVDHSGTRPIAVSTGQDDTLVVWDLRDGRRLGVTGAGHDGPIRALAVGRAGKRLLAATAADDDTLRMWDVSAIRPPDSPLLGHSGSIRVAVIVHDAAQHIAVTAGADRTIRVWDLDRGGCGGSAELSAVYQARDTVTAIAVARKGDDAVLIAGDADGRVVRVEPIARQEHSAMRLEHAIASVDCRTVGDWFVAAAVDSTGSVRGWDALSGRPIGPVVDIGVADGPGRLLLDAGCETPVAVVATDTSCRSIDLITGRMRTVLNGDAGYDMILGLGVLDDLPCVIVADTTSAEETTVWVLDLETRARLGVAQHIPAVLRAAQLADTERRPVLLAVDDCGEVWLRDLHTDIGADAPPVGVTRYPGMAHGAVAATTFPTGPAVLIGGHTGELELVDAKSGLPLIDAEPIAPAAATVAHHDGEPVVVTATARGKIMCRELATGALICPPIAAAGRLTALHTIVVAGREIVAGTGHLGAQAWDVTAMTSLADGAKASGATAVLCIEDRVVAITVHDGVLSGVDLLTGDPVGGTVEELPEDGADDRIMLAAKVVHGRPMIFGAGLLGSAVRVWDLMSGRVVGGIPAAAPITHLITTPDDRDLLYVAHTDGRIVEWPIRTLFDKPWPRLRRPRPRRSVPGAGAVTALAVHQELGLFAARDDLLEICPLDPVDARPIHLDAPIVDLTCAGDTVVVVTEQGVAVLDLVVEAYRIGRRGRMR